MRRSYILIALVTIMSLMLLNHDTNCETPVIQSPIEPPQDIYICEPVQITACKADICVSRAYTEETSVQQTLVEPQEIGYDFDIFTPCGYSYEQLLYSVSDEYRYEMVKHIDTFLEAEEKYSVNAFYIMCKIGLESGWGRYPSGENNLGGWTNSDGTYMNFESEEDCIMYIAEKLSTEYKDTSGSRLEDVCQRYCPNSGYSETLIDIMIGRKEKIDELKLA